MKSLWFLLPVIMQFFLKDVSDFNAGSSSDLLSYRVPFTIFLWGVFFFCLPIKNKWMRKSYIDKLKIL